MLEKSRSSKHYVRTLALVVHVLGIYLHGTAVHRFHASRCMPVFMSPFANQGFQVIPWRVASSLTRCNRTLTRMKRLWLLSKTSSQHFKGKNFVHHSQFFVSIGKAHTIADLNSVSNDKNTGARLNHSRFEWGVGSDLSILGAISFKHNVHGDDCGHSNASEPCIQLAIL